MEDDPLLGDDFDDVGVTDEDDEDAVFERARRHAGGDDEDSFLDEEDADEEA